MKNSTILNAHRLPSGLTFFKIPPDRLDEVMTPGELFNRSIADLLLNNESTALYHLDPANTYNLGNNFYLQPVLLGVNYHHGHSEGDYKILVQNLPERKGPWVLFRPSGSMEDTFYLQDMVFPRNFKPTFSEDVANNLKINERYFHRGDPLAIFEHFKQAGFKFINEPMSQDHIDKVGY